VKAPSASSTTTATSLPGLSMFVQSLRVIKMFKSSVCLPSLRINPPRQTTANLVAVSALRLCSEHMDTKHQNIDPRKHRGDSRNHRCRRFAKGQASHLWKKTCSDKVYTNMYRFGICASKYHRAEYTKLETLPTCLGKFAVEQAKAKSGLSEFSQKPWRSVEGHWNPWRAIGMYGNPCEPM